ATASTATTARTIGSTKSARIGANYDPGAPTPLSSASDEARRALLGERGEALFRILAREQVSELVGFLLERARREVEQPLRDPQRHRALGGKLRGDLERVVEHGIG